MAKKKILIVYGCEVSYFVHIIHIKQYILIKVAGKIIPHHHPPDCLYSTACSGDFIFRPKIR